MFCTGVIISVALFTFLCLSIYFRKDLLLSIQVIQETSRFDNLFYRILNICKKELSLIILSITLIQF